MKNQNGFTVGELVIAISVVAIFIGVGFSLYVGWHFISKFW